LRQTWIKREWFLRGSIVEIATKYEFPANSASTSLMLPACSSGDANGSTWIGTGFGDEWFNQPCLLFCGQRMRCGFRLHQRRPHHGLSRCVIRITQLTL
jgi:hypothetical protein